MYGFGNSACNNLVECVLDDKSALRVYETDLVYE